VGNEPISNSNNTTISTIRSIGSLQNAPGALHRLMCYAPAKVAESNRDLGKV
jgi:hypothetical protein